MHVKTIYFYHKQQQQQQQHTHTHTQNTAQFYIFMKNVS